MIHPRLRPALPVRPRLSTLDFPAPGPRPEQDLPSLSLYPFR